MDGGVREGEGVGVWNPSCFGRLGFGLLRVLCVWDTYESDLGFGIG